MTDNTGAGGMGGNQEDLKGHANYSGLSSKINEKPFSCLNRGLAWEVTHYNKDHSSSGLVHNAVQPRF